MHLHKAKSTDRRAKEPEIELVFSHLINLNSFSIPPEFRKGDPRSSKANQFYVWKGNLTIDG
ncbi:hypothetical protein AKJ45_00265 [candidate division MSBL1 archaeon SCGC-AAA261F19]|uniref:Uncharacterized protein n=1 Tax=candidate division MSBL1 archaeon SCGC-AAA261F19 TaxID=1698275 RepID=A0A133VBN8_9EURY|nr:hypothetical protein AKJ45_00265 [candidate division MSBL1 archaeon SCGC-AAA261F19]